MRSVVSRVFRYAIAKTRAERDPACDLRGALTVPKAKHLAAITTANGAGEFMRAIEGFTSHAITLFGLRLSAHLFVRPGKLRQAEWSEFEQVVRSIPAEKMKMGRPHRVPLFTQGARSLRTALGADGHRQILLPVLPVAPAPNVGEYGECALRDLGFSQGRMTAHGFRAMAATLLNETGRFHPDAIERQLAHMDINSVRRA
nr:hypothetical protein [Sphingopyxis sp. OPL5]